MVHKSDCFPHCVHTASAIEEQTVRRLHWTKLFCQRGFLTVSLIFAVQSLHRLYISVGFGVCCWRSRAKGKAVMPFDYLTPYFGNFIFSPRWLVGVMPYPRKSPKELCKRQQHLCLWPLPSDVLMEAVTNKLCRQADSTLVFVRILDAVYSLNYVLINFSEASFPSMRWNFLQVIIKHRSCNVPFLLMIIYTFPVIGIISPV